MRHSSARTAAAVAVLALALAGCAANGDDPGNGESSITIAISPYQFGDGLNPQGNHEGAPALQVLYETVLWKANDPARTNVEDWQPGLATEWTLSEDRREATFTVRENSVFSDGSPVNAEVIAEVINIWLESPGGATEKALGVEAEATGEFTFAYRAASPLGPNNTRLLKTLPIASPTVLADPEAYVTSPIGSGPYTLDEDSFVADTEMRLLKNPDHWDADRYPYDEIILKSFADQVAMLNALKSGQADLIDLDISAQAEAEASGFEIVNSLPRVSTLIFFDLKGTLLAPIGDVRVRQAMNLAFDRETINEEVAFGKGYVTSQIFPFQATAGYLGAGYLQGEDDYYDYDIERALELMADAGYADGFDITIPSFPDQLGVALEPIVEQSLADIGIRVTYEQYPDISAFFGAVLEGIYPVILLSTYYVDLYTSFFSSTSWALGPYPGFTDETVQELAVVVVEGTPEEQAEGWQQLGRHVLEEAWFAPFAYIPRGYAQIPEIDTEIVDLTGVIYPWNIRPAE